MCIDRYNNPHSNRRKKKKQAAKLKALSNELKQEREASALDTWASGLKFPDSSEEFLYNEVRSKPSRVEPAHYTKEKRLSDKILTGSGKSTPVFKSKPPKGVG